MQSQRAVHPPCQEEDTMKNATSRLPRLLASAATVAALAFGTTQAFAAPSSAPKAAPYCSHDLCDVQCQGEGHAAGHCVNWRCVCLG
jgi:hypothetical protein